MCLHKNDYWDTCAQKNAEVRAKQTTLNRLQQAAASLPEDLQRLEDEIKAIRQSLEIHRKESDESHNYYTEITKKCSEKWKRIIELEGKTGMTADECDELAILHNSFTVVIPADYQMSKLVPNWGQTPQPGSTKSCTCRLLREPDLTLQKGNTANPTTDKVEVNAVEKDRQRQQGERRKNQCGKCGSWQTRQQSCPAIGVGCHKCGQRNPFARVCHSNTKKADKPRLYTPSNKTVLTMV